MKNDEELMRDYCEGSEEAFGHLYEKYSPLVYAFIRKRMRDSEIEDVYQKVWRHLHEKRVQYKEQPFAPWFFVMMRNLIVDEYRSLARKKLKGQESELIEKIYSQEKGDHELEEILSTLSEETRRLVEKYYLDGVSYEELENQTGMSQANLRQRLSRTIRGLRKFHEK